ncbi:MAG: hypothetical protein N3C12_04700 [Candidatus Binatia bacterium]|nr:hypothetical protein [Candidatus Binatia bacterium]
MRLHEPSPHGPRFGKAFLCLAFLVAALAVTSLGSGCGNGDGTRGFALCGNGVLDPGEQCDDGNLADDDDCLSTCVVARCGDGFVASFAAQQPETCDGINLGSFCLDRLPELHPCRDNNDCPRAPSGPVFVNPCQQPSCAAFGLSGGPLGCSPACTFALASCGPAPTATHTPLPPTPTPTRTPRATRTPS